MKRVLAIIIIAFCCFYVKAQVLPMDVNTVPATSVKAGQKFYVTENINGKEVWRKITAEQFKGYVIAAIPNMDTAIFMKKGDSIYFATKVQVQALQNSLTGYLTKSQYQTDTAFLARKSQVTAILNSLTGYLTKSQYVQDTIAFARDADLLKYVPLAVYNADKATFVTQNQLQNVLLDVYDAINNSGTHNITVSEDLPRLPFLTQLHYDRLRKVMYNYKKNDAWYYQGLLIRHGIPSDTTYLVSDTLVTIKYTDATLFNLDNKSYYDYNYEDSVWRNRNLISVDSLLYTHNTWYGKNTFKDSVTVDKGLKSGGVIDTKGLSSVGSSSQTAMTIQGAVAEKDTVINTDNFQSTWNYGIYAVLTLTANKTIKLPPIGDNNDWTISYKNETLDTNGYTLFIKDNLGNAVYQLTGKIIVKFKIKNLQWERESVSIF